MSVLSNCKERLLNLLTEMKMYRVGPIFSELIQPHTAIIVYILQDFGVSMDQALFQPFPSEVVFQQFQPQQMYEFPLNFRNNDRVRN